VLAEGACERRLAGPDDPGDPDEQVLERFARHGPVPPFLVPANLLVFGKIHAAGRRGNAALAPPDLTIRGLKTNM
jgi:hypothetical protein